MKSLPAMPPVPLPITPPPPPNSLTPVKTDVARGRFMEFLEKKRLRVTGQRMAIFDAAAGRRQHFTAEDLLGDARAIDPSVSRATVYRSLPILVESGLVREVDIGRDFKYYASTGCQAAFQAQIACPDCEKIVEVDAPFMEWYGKTMAGRHEMELVSQRLQIIARCKECTAKATRQ
ncbi:MAG: transcriptional repressor [Puniceicoccales bacterium]|nr:transcriptional repressor [Puniceicoccales bacterium]